MFNRKKKSNRKILCPLIDRLNSIPFSNKIGDETSTDITGSAVSGSSVLSENSGPSDRSSRRALILQMAKARMKNNRESPNKGSSAVTEEDEANDTVFTDGNSLLTAQDIDLTSDLD